MEKLQEEPSASYLVKKMAKSDGHISEMNHTERIGKLEEITAEKHKTISQKKKELEEYEKQKKKELEDLDKKKEKEIKDLESKRKEIEKLESDKLKEIEDNQRLIDSSFQEVIRHKKILADEEKEKIKQKEFETIDEIAAEASVKNKPGTTNQINYSRFFENLEAPKQFYQVNNNTFYNGLNQLLDKARDGEITREEQQFIDNLRSKFEQFNNNDSYADRDRSNYLKRSMAVIERIGTYSRLRE